MEETMKSRINRTIIIFTTAAVLCVSALTTAAGEKVLKLASFVPPIYILHKPIFLKFADDLSAATNGSVKVEVYPSGELGKGPAEQYIRAAKRIAEISYGLPGYTSPMFPRNLLIELPGVTQGHRDATEKIWKVMDKHLIG
jgi:TRAP-type C4-dicarboxylate transport system substrate-binding protein